MSGKELGRCLGGNGPRKAQSTCAVPLNVFQHFVDGVDIGVGQLKALGSSWVGQPASSLKSIPQG